MITNKLYNFLSIEIPDYELGAQFISERVYEEIPSISLIAYLTLLNLSF